MEPYRIADRFQRLEAQVQRWRRITASTLILSILGFAVIWSKGTPAEIRIVSRDGKRQAVISAEAIRFDSMPGHESQPGTRWQTSLGHGSLELEDAAVSAKIRISPSSARLDGNASLRLAVSEKKTFDISLGHSDLRLKGYSDGQFSVDLQKGKSILMMSPDEKEGFMMTLDKDKGYSIMRMRTPDNANFGVMLDKDLSSLSISGTKGENGALHLSKDNVRFYVNDCGSRSRSVWKSPKCDDM